LAAPDQSNCFLLEFQRAPSPNGSCHAQTLQSRSYTTSLGRRSSAARSSLDSGLSQPNGLREKMAWR
jgi:hypothetical protein